MAHYARLAVLALVALASSCRSKVPVVDTSLASCVPADTVVLAGLNLDQIRATPLYRALLPEVLDGIQSLRDTSILMIAYNAHDLLFLGSGKYTEAPSGATLISKNLVVSGTAESIRSAIAQHQTGVTGSPRLLELAAGIADGRPVWMVAQGG